VRTCEECPKRETCVEPCEWLKNELKKVTKARNKQEGSFNDYMEPEEWPTRDIPSRCRDRTQDHHFQLKKLIIQLYLDGYSSREIAYHLPCSDRYVRKVVGTTYVNKRAEKIRKNRY
jgi:hypothetical protein